jgi:DMSO/TMAO reductase YedYZ molybdopterin-dependent catalytic subunit
MTQSTSGRPGLAGSPAGALCGLLAAAGAMGVAQLFAGLSVPQASPVLAVGQAAINLTPGPVKDWAVSSFGADDKDVLLAGVIVVIFAFAAVIGVLAVRRLALGMAGLAVIAAIGLAAALTRNGASAAYALPTLAGTAAGAFALSRLVAAAQSSARMSLPPPPLPPITFGTDSPADLNAPDLPGSSLPGDELRAPDPPGSNVPALRLAAPPARRTFLLTAGTTLTAAAVSGLAGRQLATRKNVSAARASIRLPRPTVPAPPLPSGVNLPVPGISPFITPNGQFYRVDTDLFLPQVDPSAWQLRIHGMVQREIVVTFDELLRRPLTEDYITLCCVSNSVGGPYIGNAKWLGASLASLLRAARPLGGASQLLCTSVDGFTSGTPLSVVLDGRDALVAVAMNGTALPVEHGFPARLVVPGLYGYVSACKWVTDIEVTTFQAASAYWTQRGWSQQAPIKTESRIDVPVSGSSVRAGRVAVAGVAWAQHKGIEAVEVQVDNGPWQEATLAAVPGIDCWRQWVWEWDASVPGPHTIQARATDKTGYTQTAIQAPEVPNGASGYPSATVTVS